MNIKIKDIKNRLNQSLVAEFLILNGTKINKDYKFVNDKSFSISRDGLIKDFGSSAFCGDLIDYLQKFNSLSMNDATNKIAEFLNITNKEKELNYSKTVTISKNNLEDIAKALDSIELPKGKLQELIDVSLLMENIDLTKQVIKDIVRWSKIDDSIAIVQRNKNNAVQFIAIHRSKNFLNSDGTRQKWIKRKGSNNSYIPHYFTGSNIVFVNVGIKELIVNRLLEIDYFTPVSDTVIKNLHSNEMFQNEIKPMIDGKIVAYLVENDEASRNTIEILKSNLDNCLYFLPIRIEDLFLYSAIFHGGCTADCKKGFDFVDYANYYKSIKSIKKELHSYINMELSDGKL